MTQHLNKAAVHILTALAISMILLAPGYFFRFIGDKPILWFNSEYLWIFAAFGLVLSLCRSYTVVAATLTFLGLLEITQFGSLYYSGDFLTPYTVEFMLREFSEIVIYTQFNIGHLFYMPLVVIAPYALGLFILWKTRTIRCKMKWASLLVALFLIFPAARVRLHSDRFDIANFFASPADPSLANTLNTYAVLVAVILPERLLTTPSRVYQPYVVNELPDNAGPKTIVLVMGESMTANHMSLLGYERPTTPFLSSMAEDPNFVFKKGYSGATSTRSSLPMFYTLQYDPENNANLAHQPANLFRLAKQHGFRTVYISAQNGNCLSGFQISSIDVLMTYESDEKLFDTQKDDALLTLIRKVELGPRNFIVLHQRNIHAPYQYNYSHHPDLAKYPVDGLPQREASINAYDNSMLYNDWLFRQMIELFRERVSSPLYFWITSDHGEALGEQGFWGHDRLDLETATVPILFYGTGEAAAYVGRIQEMHLPTHYEMGKLIAEQLGFEIVNPDEEPDLFYVQGVVALGNGGYMKCRRTGDKVVSESEFVR